MSAISLDGVFEALAAQPRISSGEGRALMFIAARRKEGVTGAAVAAANAAGPGAVYAIDLDLQRNALGRALSEGAPLGPKIDGALNGVSFCAAVDAQGRVIRSVTPFSYHRKGRTRLFVGAFDSRVMPQGARVHVSSAPAYWDAARAGGATVVVDGPALERSRIALRVARHMDGVVLVVGSDPGAAPAAVAAKQALLSAGANLIGLVYTGASAPVMAMERLLRQAS
jgi:hypothetical protein